MNPIQLPSTYNLQYETSSAIDGATNTMYVATMIGQSYGIATIDLVSGKIVKEVAINNKTCSSNLLVSKIWFDSSSGSLFGTGSVFTSDQTAVYGYLSLNPSSGACSSTPLNFPGDLVSSWTYDSSSGILWFAAGGIGSGFLSNYNTKNNTLGPVIPLAGYTVPTSLEISLSF